ncbi:MAG: hypothetical protein J4G16_09180 [Acidobacteria bacterium]|nr:hypothetical protein [Acidobacteriota bacterium]
MRDGESLARASIVNNYGRLIGMTVADRLTVLATGAVVAVSIIGGSVFDERSHRRHARGAECAMTP